MKRNKNKHAPAYTHPRATFAGIEERLTLVSMVSSKTWRATVHEQETWRFDGDYMHTVRFLSKKDGWETNFIWRDNCNHIDLNQRGVKRALAIGIEGARARWFENQRPSKELLAIVAKMQERKAAA